MHNDTTDDRLADYFSRGIEPSDVPALFSLQRARGAINSLMTVFNGTEAAVMARLLVLREAGARGDAPFSTASELRDRNRELKEGAARLSALESGRTPEDDDVREFREALRQAAIAHCMLPEIMEITDRAWHGAVEAVLRSVRHIVLLDDPKESAHAWRLGERSSIDISWSQIVSRQHARPWDRWPNASDSPGTHRRGWGVISMTFGASSPRTRAHLSRRTRAGSPGPVTGENAEEGALRRLGIFTSGKRRHGNCASGSPSRNSDVLVCRKSSEKLRSDWARCRHCWMASMLSVNLRGVRASSRRRC